MKLPAFLTAEFLPPELLTNYTQDQLSSALVMRTVADAQDFAQAVQATDELRAEIRAAGAGEGPYPRLSADFEAEMKAVLDCGAEALGESRRSIASMRDLRTKASDVLTRYRQYVKEVRAVLQTIEDSPKG